MKLNCKPGDLAVVIKESPKAVKPIRDRFVTVISMVPAHTAFRLPDGYWQCANALDQWLVHWHCPVLYPTDTGVHRSTNYGLLPDYALRPIRDPGDDAVDETLSWLPVPELERA